MLSSKSRKIIIFEQINAQAGIFGSLDAYLHLYKRVCPSIHLSVTLLSKTRKINIFEQMNAQAGILGSLNASLYKDGLSVGQSINPFVTIVHLFHDIKTNQQTSKDRYIRDNDNYTSLRIFVNYNSLYISVCICFPPMSVMLSRPWW